MGIRERVGALIVMAGERDELTDAAKAQRENDG
jgi:hypothetical protein